MKLYRLVRNMVSMLVLLATQQTTHATTASGYEAAGEIASLFLKKNITLHGSQVGYLRQQGRKIINVDLVKGRNYIFVVGGCTDAYDLDLALFDIEASKAIAVDTDNNKVAVVRFTPPVTKSYALLIGMTRSTSNGAHFAVLMGELEGDKEESMTLGRMDLQTSIQGADGRNTNLAAVFRSTGAKYIYLRLWASWCGPCIALLPNLESRYETLPDKNIAVISVNAEKFAEGGSLTLAKVTAAKHSLKTPVYVLPAGSPLIEQLKVDAIPRSVIIKSDGEVIFNGHPLDKRLPEILERLGVTEFDLTSRVPSRK